MAMAFTEIALIYERHSPLIRLTVLTGNGSVCEKKKKSSSRVELTEKLLMVLRQSRDESRAEGAFIK